MIEKMKAIVRGKDVCVLATVSGGEPHCSLMSYAPDDDCRELYMMTHRNTKKFRNLSENRAVSLLIDTREEGSAGGKQGIKALTVGGRFRRIDDDAERAQAHALLLKRHPNLKDLAQDPDVEVFAVKVKSLQLLEGISDAHFAIME